MQDTEPAILVIDLEATCWESMTPEGEPQSIHNMEIIELGCALTNRLGTVLESRSFMVRPVRQPTLSSFCTRLTHITQDMVDDAPVLPEALGQLDAWLGPIGSDFLWCSWGNYDLNHLRAQCERENVDSRLLSAPHLNLKKLWRRTTKERKKTSLAAALTYHGLEFEGQPHRGVDDARNIARLFPFLAWAQAGELVSNPTASTSAGLPRKNCC